MAWPIQISRPLIALTLSLILAACDWPQQQSQEKATPAPASIDAQAFAAQAGLEAYTGLSRASQSAQVVDSKLASFLYHPNPMTHGELKQAWRQAYDDFLRAMVFAYLPIQDPPEWYSKHIAYRDLLTQLDSWPIQGGYIDYVPGYPFSGIVNDLTLVIDEQTLRNQHLFTDNSNASIGYHALEFMLWGDNGERSPHDFFPQENTAPVLLNEGEHNHENSEAGLDQGTEPAPEVHAHTEETNQPGMPEPQNHNRRRQYVQVISEVLQKDLIRVQRRWEPSTGYYAQLIQQSTPDNTLQAALIAAQRLISEEILNKRFTLESSEFSASSARDIEMLLHGLQLWFNPEDDGLQEGSLMFLMEQASAAKAGAFMQQLEQSQQCLATLNSDPEKAKVEQCKQQVIGLLSALQNNASSLRVALPALD